jgi:hypothetical protein
MGHKGERKRKVGQKKVKSLPAEPATGSISALLKAAEILSGKSQAVGEGISSPKERVNHTPGGKQKFKKG